ncbi:MAG TPA: tetratricopeptide repeat protein [Pyrinomonadaceae bacterium]|jgi:tetratricopeptide (TPR) repeat protein|nr:tetratricopeptide repeat protein [Pyrinomonadaceae bacterium]
MTNARLYKLIKVCALTGVLALAFPARSQDLLHQIEGRIQFKTGTVPGMRVRLLRRDSLEPVGDTFSHPDGGFVFTRVSDGEYLIETAETDTLEATSTEVILRPRPRRSITFNVFIDIPSKSSPARSPATVVAADVDLDVPKAASKHYKSGKKALERGDSAGAFAELREAITAYPNYYAARLDLGRELRLEKQFKEAEEVLNPLPQIAPRRAEPRLEYGIVLLELKRPDEAAAQLTEALQLEEANWATHLYLGWALLEGRSDEAEPHFKRALEIDQRKSVRAHLALARIAAAHGSNELAIQHLEAFLAMMPDAPDAEAARRLADKLRASK